VTYTITNEDAFNGLEIGALSIPLVFQVLTSRLIPSSTFCKHVCLFPLEASLVITCTGSPFQSGICM
jgi:hypothetical protein